MRFKLIVVLSKLIVVLSKLIVVLSKLILCYPLTKSEHSLRLREGKMGEKFCFSLSSAPSLWVCTALLLVTSSI